MTFGSMTALLQLYGKISGPIGSFAGIGKQFIHGIAAAERLIKIKNLPVELINQDLKHLNIEKTIIEFEHVFLDYN